MFYLYCIVSAESRAGDMEIVPNRGGGRLTRGVGDRDRDLAAGCLVNSYFLSLSPCPSSSPFLAFSLSLYLPVSPCMPVPAAAP